MHETLELAELVHRIQDALNASAQAMPSDVRRLCMAAEADLLRASIRLVNARAMVASAGNAAHVAELGAMIDDGHAVSTDTGYRSLRGLLADGGRAPMHTRLAAPAEQRPVTMPLAAARVPA